MALTHVDLDLKAATLSACPGLVIIRQCSEATSRHVTREPTALKERGDGLNPIAIAVSEPFLLPRTIWPHFRGCNSAIHRVGSFP